MLVLSILTLLSIASVERAVARRPARCEPGRFELVSALPVAGAEAIVVDRRTVAIVDGCEPTRGQVRAAKRATKVSARWRTCDGIAGRARLDARILAPDCTTMEGTFRVPRTGTRVAVQAERASSTSTTTTTTGPVTTTTAATSTCVAAAPAVPPLRVIPVNAVAGNFATFAKQPPGSTDWYLVEQSGLVRIIRDGQFLPTPFLDLRAAMGVNPGERGLLSIAFHPGYAENGRFFTMGTPADRSDGSYAPLNADAVVEWRRDPTNPDVAVPTKVRDIVVLPASAPNHDGGTILFGPDNRLYVGTGDGGGGCESSQPGAVQDTSNLFGKILRLDVDAAPPFAAASNPFANDPRVYHYGLRNPFRFNFDRPTRDLYIGDVGQVSFEEIDVAAGTAGGRNFGWPAVEGPGQNTCGSKPLGGPSPVTGPIVSVDRRSGSTDPFSDYASIIAGGVYRGAALPELSGVFLFADFYGAEIGALRYCNGQVYGPVAIPLAQILTPDGELSSITSFVEGNDGELYLTYGGATRVGRIAPQ